MPPPAQLTCLRLQCSPASHNGLAGCFLVSNDFHDPRVQQTPALALPFKIAFRNDGISAVMCLHRPTVVDFIEHRGYRLGISCQRML